MIIRLYIFLFSECLWAVVNNAGIAAITEIEFCPIEEYRNVLDVNAIGPIRVTKTFLPSLRKSQGSRIIIVASLAGKKSKKIFRNLSNI